MYCKEYTLYVLLVLLSVLSTGCAFFTVPEEVAVPASFEPISLSRQAHSECCKGHSNYFDSFEKVDQAVRSGRKALEHVTEIPNPGYDVDEKNYVLVDKFLHLSDAHIRDERIYAEGTWKKQLWRADWIKDVTVRSPYIQAFDWVSFAAFLSGAAKLEQPPGRKFSFIVHTGDLLDISLITELVQSLKIMRAFTKEYTNLPIYSVAGNHDGVTWGNIPDKPDKIVGLFDRFGVAHARGLGVNRTEFVLGHILADPNLNLNQGFGFGRNEIIRRFSSKTKKDIKAFRKSPPTSNTERWDLVCDQLEDIVDAVKERHKIYKEPNDVEWLLSYPAVFRNAIHTTGEGDREGLKCGYYSWPRKVKDIDGLKGIRYIALDDTRNSLLVGGQMDDVQLGWLYNELAEALIGKECVIIFAHYPPSEIKSSSFHRMLKEFQNIAAYFYGHVHPTDKYDPERYGPNNILLVQTPSLIDFPQTAREVEVYMPRHKNDGDPLDVKFRWQHVRPKGSKKKREGLLLETILDTCRRESKKEYNKPALLHLFEPHGDTVDSYQEWVDKNLQSDGRLVEIEFTKNAVEPRRVFKDDMERINSFRGHLGLPLVLYPPLPSTQVVNRASELAR